MPNSLKLLFSPEARQDLLNIGDYIAIELCNPSAALNLTEKIYSALSAACTFPESGLKVNNEYITDKTVKKLVVDNYLVFYKVVESLNALLVLRIIYGMQNYKDIL